MLSYNERIAIGLSVVTFSVIAGVRNYKELNTPMKVLLLVLGFKLIAEIIADYSARVYKTNMPIIGIAQPIELLLIGIYFNYSVDSLRKKLSGYYIGVIGLAFGLLNYLYLQSPYEMNYLFLVFKGIIVVGLCLYAYYRLLLLDDDLVLVYDAHFWVTSILLFYWITTTLLWGMYDFLISQLKIDGAIIHFTLFFVNIITYLGFGTVFLLYKKMKTHNGG